MLVCPKFGHIVQKSGHLPSNLQALYLHNKNNFAKIEIVLALE